MWLLLLLTFLTGLVLTWRLIDGEPVVQAADALRLDETALEVSVACERLTTAEGSGLAFPASTYQEPAVSPDVPNLFPRVLTVAEERLLALPLTGSENRTQGCRLAP